MKKNCSCFFGLFLFFYLALVSNEFIFFCKPAFLFWFLLRGYENAIAFLKGGREIETERERERKLAHVFPFSFTLSLPVHESNLSLLIFLQSAILLSLRRGGKENATRLPRSRKSKNVFFVVVTVVYLYALSFWWMNGGDWNEKKSQNFLQVLV